MDDQSKQRTIELFDQIPQMFAESFSSTYQQFGDYQLAINATMNLAFFSKAPLERSVDKGTLVSLIGAAKELKTPLYFVVNDYTIESHQDLLLSLGFELEGNYIGVFEDIREMPVGDCSRIEMREVSGRAEQVEFTKIYNEAFKVPSDIREEVSAVYFSEEDQTKSQGNFLGRLIGEDFAMANYTVFNRFDDIAYGGGVGIYDRFRGQGLGKEVINGLLKEMMVRNINLLAALAKEDTSLPIMEQLGCRRIWRHNLLMINFS